MYTFHHTVQSKLNELKEVDGSLETWKNINGENLRFKDVAQTRKSVNEAKVKVASCVHEPLKYEFCDVKVKKMNVNLKAKELRKRHTFKGKGFCLLPLASSRF